MKYLGLIEITSGRVTVSDPCYEPGNGCALSLNVKPGAYLCFAQELRGRIEFIEIRHACHVEVVPDSSIDTVCVDSGQCGFFDADFYKNNQGGAYEDEDSFYGKACKITLSEEQAGILDGKGFVSSSGWGDGEYEVLVGYGTFVQDEDKVVSLSIFFL